MHAILGLGATAFLLCLGLTPLCRDLFIRFAIVDHPDADRKLHLKPIPRIGGIPIVLAYGGALGLMLLLAPHGARISIQHTRLLQSLLPAAALIFAVGLVDDLIGLKPRHKLAGQVAASVLAVALGARLTAIHGMPHTPWIMLPLSVLWLVFCSNAVNLIDGLDGLASGVGLFAVLATLLAAGLSGNLGLAMATAPLAGCLLAFLRYNFSPASIFLGDCGSLTIGFLLGCFGLIWSQRSGSLVGIVAPMMALALPLIEVGLSISRRYLRSAPIFQADRRHIHHMVLALGFKPRDAALILYGVCGLSGFLALLLTFMQRPFRGLILVVFCSLALTGIHLLGYVELSVARRTLSHRNMLRVLKEEIYLQELERAITSANSPATCWSVVRTACGDMHFASVQMLLHDESFEEVFDARDTDPSWRVTLSIGRRGHLILTRVQDRRPPKLMASVLDLLQSTLREKETAMRRMVHAVEDGRMISGAA